MHDAVPPSGWGQNSPLLLDTLFSPLWPYGVAIGHHYRNALRVCSTGNVAQKGAPVTDGAAGRAFNPVALVTRRKERNWTQAQLAAKSGRALKTVVAWESGARCPTPAHLLALATTLGVPAADLIGIPRAQWHLAELRSTVGMDRKEAARRMGMSVERLRHLEGGVNQLSPADADLIAEHYQSTSAEVRACWERANAALTAD